MNLEQLAAMCVVISAAGGCVLWWFRRDEEARLFVGGAVAATGLAVLLALSARHEAFVTALDALGPFLKNGVAPAAVAALDRAEGDYRLLASCAAFAITVGIVGVFCRRL